jgi:hypothetical protein
MVGLSGPALLIGGTSRLWDRADNSFPTTAWLSMDEHVGTNPSPCASPIAGLNASAVSPTPEQLQLVEAACSPATRTLLAQRLLTHAASDNNESGHAMLAASSSSHQPMNQTWRRGVLRKPQRGDDHLTLIYCDAQSMLGVQFTSSERRERDLVWLHHIRTFSLRTLWSCNA